jgi:hypothetical protein
MPAKERKGKTSEKKNTTIKQRKQLREEGNEKQPVEVEDMPEDRCDADKGDSSFYKKWEIVPISVDEKLAAFFEDNPLFYDITNESYKNLPLRNATLQSFGLKEGLHREYFSPFLAHLSQSDRVSFCGRFLSGVRPSSVRKLLL